MNAAHASLIHAGWVVLFGFALALILLDAYEALLPRGGGIAMGGSLVGAMIVLSAAPLAVIVAVSATALVYLGLRVARRPGPGAVETLVRAVAAMSAFVVLRVAQGTPIAAADFVVIPAVYLGVEYLLRQVERSFREHRSVVGLIRSGGTQQALLMAAQLSTAALTVITQESMGLWSLLPVLGLLLLMRQANAMLFELHETYRSTVSILIEAAEAQTPELSGHSDRTARVARDIAMRCGLTSLDVDMVEYAALLHDVDRISADGDQQASASLSADVIRDVEFLRAVVPILDLMEGQVAQVSDRVRISAFIVALASAIDSEQSGIEERSGSLAVLSALLPGRVKATVVGAALGLGYSVPAIY